MGIRGAYYHGTVFSLTGTYTTPANLTWSAGVVCTVTFTDPQPIGGMEYQFVSSTINGSSVSHTNPLTFDSSYGMVLERSRFPSS